MIQKERIKKLYWEEGNTIEDIADKFHISYWKLYGVMNKYNIVRRNRSEAGYIYYKLKPQFRIKTGLSITEEKLKIAGIMLYWAEGTLKGNTVDFVNSNSKMVEIFLQFMREICVVSEKRLRIYLYCYSDQNLESLRNYWSDITKVPLQQFTKPYVRKNNPNFSSRKLPYGLIHIRYNDKHLLEQIKYWINEWAGTQVAKGGRLYKSSVLLKSRM